MVDLGLHRLALRPQPGGDGGEALGHPDQQVLHGRHVRGLSADAGPGAAGAAGGLLALIAEHFIFRHKLLLADAAPDSVKFRAALDFLGR